LVAEGWSLGRVRAYKELVGLVWIVDATHPETGRSLKVEGSDLDKSLQGLRP
jgi:hypothetical protein